MVGQPTDKCHLKEMAGVYDHQGTNSSIETVLL